jgi:predicted porin
MKKSLLALAVAGAFSGAAFAQSSVTLFGVVDTGISYYKGDGNGSIWAMSNSGINSSRFGVRGTEDLGGGLKANFWLEGSVNTDNGSGVASNTNNQVSGGNPSCTVTGATPAVAGGTVTCAAAANGSQGFTFNRRMFVGLSGGFGELRLGRNYTPLFWQVTNNDPFGTNGVGDTKIYNLTGLVGAGAVTTTVRASNAIEYLTPPGIGGVYFHGMYAFGENATDNGAVSNPNSRDGNTAGARIGYAGGPIDISAAVNQTHLFQTPAQTQGTYTGIAISTTLTFGNFKPMAQYIRNKIDLAGGPIPDQESDNWMLGIVMTFGPVDLRASYNKYNLKNTSNDAQQFAIGPIYNLSRRTALYATYALMDNQGAQTAFVTGARPTVEAGGKTMGIDMGIRHSF